MRLPPILPALLYPADAEVAALARAETSAERHREFAPVAGGFVGNALLICLWVLLAALTTPLRLIWRLCRRGAGGAAR